jgi:hypothetical protein
MTYYDLVKAIEKLALKAGAQSFWTGARLANGINYNAPFPMVEFFNTQPSQIKTSVVRYNIGMGFYGKDEHENGGEQTLQIQSDMDELTQRFIRLLTEWDDFEMLGDTVNRVPVVRKGTKIGTGLFIDFTLDVPLPPC